MREPRGAVVFDWNGTLSNMDVLARQDVELARQYGVTRTEEFVRTLWGSPGVLLRLLDFPAERQEELQQAFWELDSDPRFARQLHPDVLPTIGALKTAGFVLGVMTGGIRTKVLGYMEQAGLPVEEFEFIHTGDEIDEDVQAGRPALAKAVTIFGKTGLGLDSITFVGDEPTDVRNAGEASVNLAIVRRADSHMSLDTLLQAGAPPQRIITSLNQLPNLLLANT